MGLRIIVRKLLLSALFAVVVGTGAARAAEVVVQVAPPRLVVEHRGVRPSREHVWVGGYHRWDGNAYAWQAGRWEAPPRPHAVWVAPRWEHRRDGYVMVEGRWR